MWLYLIYSVLPEGICFVCLGICDFPKVHWKRIYQQIKYLKPHLTCNIIYIFELFMSILLNCILLKLLHIFWYIELFLRKANIIANSTNISKRSLDSIMFCWIVRIQFHLSKSFRLLIDLFEWKMKKENIRTDQVFIDIFSKL